MVDYSSYYTATISKAKPTKFKKGHLASEIVGFHAECRHKTSLVSSVFPVFYNFFGFKYKFCETRLYCTVLYSKIRSMFDQPMICWIHICTV
jgi:hypothetical protein